MVAIQVRDVPDDVREALSAEAARRGQSLQFFLADVLAREAASARNLAWLRERTWRPAVAAGSDTRDLIRDTWEERDQSIESTASPSRASR
jgi:hypothetical protein